MVGQGRGKVDGVGPSARATRRPSQENVVHSRTIQRTSAQGKYSQFANGKSAFGRTPRIRRRNPFRHEHRSTAGPEIWAFNEGLQPGARLRKIEPGRP